VFQSVRYPTMLSWASDPCSYSLPD